MQKLLTALSLATLLIVSTQVVASQAAAQEPELIHGVMRFSSLEGGCWYLETEGGKRFELLADSSIIGSLHIPDRMLSVLVTPAKHAATTCMIGEIVNVVRIVDSVRHPVDMLVMNLQVTGTVHCNKAGQWYVRTAKGVKYLLTKPEKKYRHIGLKYNEFDRAIRGPEPENGFYATIIGPGEKEARRFEKKADPR
jgi:hypothetical protein